MEYTRWGVCDPSQGCPPDWHISQSPSITVQSPPLGRGSEYPVGARHGDGIAAGRHAHRDQRLGPRDIPDVSVQVDVDVDIDLDFGFSFFSLF